MAPNAIRHFYFLEETNINSMIRKTYGVSGLMDWTTQIKAGKGSVSVHFTGGALTAYGVTPAKFSTSNPFFQNAIENSEQFQSGRIELIGEMEVADEDRPAVTNTSEDIPTKEGEAHNGEKLVNDSHGAGAVVGECKIEVADKSEAIEYLKEHYSDKNYSATGLRTKGAFEAACEECGVTFVFTA
mgnify:FL=1